MEVPCISIRAIHTHWRCGRLRMRSFIGGHLDVATRNSGTSACDTISARSIPRFAMRLTCPACGTGEWDSMERYAPFHRCRACGLVGNPDETLAESYEAGYFTQDDQGHRDFGSTWAQAYDQARFIPELRLLERSVVRRCLLDVGCATGGFMALAEQRGWTTAGMDVSADALEIATKRGLEVSADLNSLGPRAPFDAVTMHHVLEHVRDPVDTLERVGALVGDAGVVLLEVPNFRSAERVAMGGGWMDLRPDQHRWMFTPKSLRATVARSKVLAVRSVWTAPEPLSTRHSLLRSLAVPEVVNEWLDRRHRVDLGAPQRPEAVTTDTAAVISPNVRHTSGRVDAWVARRGYGKRLIALLRPIHA